MLLPRPAQSLDRVVVETVLVRFSNQQVQELLSIWDQVDESILDLPLRERLDRNGLRAGLLVGELPSLVRQKLESEASQLGTLEAADLAADIDEKMRRLQCRAGRRKELLVRPTLNQPLTVISTDGQEVRGDTFERPTVLFDLRAVPYGNKQVAIELTPEIQHGDFQQAFVASEFGVRPETRRPRKAWRALTVACQLSPGQVFVVAATQPAKALGTAFFQTETAEQSREHVVLLLRVGESGLDELFAPEKAAQIQSLIER